MSTTTPVIVAFLQNQWWPPKSIKSIEYAYRKHGSTPEGRADLNARYLFFRCLTGRRLKLAFGDDLCNEIIWENASSQIASLSNQAFPPDVDHITKVILHFKPQIVITLGKQALNGLAEAEKLILPAQRWKHHMIGPHPAARQPSVRFELKAIAVAVKTWKE